MYTKLRDCTVDYQNNSVMNLHVNLVVTNVETGRHDSALVQTADEVDNQLSRAVIIDVLELTNVSVLLHDTQETDDYLNETINRIT